jgi:hypothetical protein
VISAAEISSRFQKIRFWKETSVEDEFILGPMAQATLVNMNHTMYLHLFTINSEL